MGDDGREVEIVKALRYGRFFFNKKMVGWYEAWIIEKIEFKFHFSESESGWENDE